jgi:hypothetical protein
MRRVGSGRGAGVPAGTALLAELSVVHAVDARTPSRSDRAAPRSPRLA